MYEVVDKPISNYVLLSNNEWVGHAFLFMTFL